MNTNPVTYEITATVEADLCDEYERYMIEQHIPDLLEAGAFERANFSRSTQGRYRVQYPRNRKALDKYLAEHAERLRQHFAETFPTGIEISREEWDHIGTWAA